MPNIRSMTGVGTASGKIGSRIYSVEAYSVNNRYLDISIRFPSSQWVSYELPLEKMAKQFFKRGKINALITEARGSEKRSEPVVNKKLLEKYFKELAPFSKKLGLKSLELGDLLKLPQVINTSSEASAEKPPLPQIEKIVKAAFQALLASREKEGMNLKKDFLKRLSHLTEIHTAIKERADENLKIIHDRILERAKRLNETITQDPDRLAREVAFLAERSDISEELTRFKSHLGLFEKTLEKSGEVGKELDFILQEFNREANTIASKAGDFGIAKEVIQVKAEIEKIREQVQNIE
jgi:uncharacterized protein (TIGR00255 family)